jgi:hypothetical protein
VPPPVETRSRHHDAKNLYIAFARTTRGRRKSGRTSWIATIRHLIQDDHVGVMIDTFNDERRAFQFRVNPLGVQADAVFSEQDGVDDFSWDMIWTAVGRITGDGYLIEMALPLKQPRFRAGRAADGGLRRSGRTATAHRISSQRRDRNLGCLPQEKIAAWGPGRNLEFDPTGTFSRTDELAAPTDSGLTRGDVKAEAGLSARWSMTSSLTMNGTINPDFSQIEADVAQLDVNQRFALFYPEKRPFFLEDCCPRRPSRPCSRDNRRPTGARS